MSGKVTRGDTFFIGLQILEVETELPNDTRKGSNEVKYRCRDLRSKKAVVLSESTILRNKRS